MKRDTKIGIITWFSLMIPLLIGLFLYARYFRQVNTVIDSDGIFTVGTVTNLVVMKGKASHTELYFEFYHEGRKHIGSNWNDKFFEYAVEGKQYYVKYVPDKLTEKVPTDYARIYIDLPVSQYMTEQEKREQEQYIQYLKQRDSLSTGQTDTVIVLE